MFPLIFLAPLPTWALSSARWGRALGAVLAVLVALELAVAWRVILPATCVTPLVCPPIATAVLDAHEEDVEVDIVHGRVTVLLEEGGNEP